MPVDKQVLLRYKVLNKCFRNKYKEFTIDDLVDECNKELRKKDLQSVSKRTIQNDINLLEADYGIELVESLKQGRKRVYRYVDTDYTLPLYRMNDEERNKIEEAIDVLNQFQGEPIYDWVRTILMQIEGGLFDGQSSPAVSFQGNLDLKGINHFSRLLQAIIHKRVLKMKYTPYGKPQFTAIVYPYHLKEYNNRWFLIAKSKGYDSYFQFALDRIDEFKEIAVEFKEADIEFDEYFDDVIGVSIPENEPVDIVLKIKKPRFEYIRTKPLHLSQKIKEENGEYGIISINVKVNKELVSHVLSYGSDLEVLAPESFRKLIAEDIFAMNKKYVNNEENLHS